jgi:hypothetical protein
MVDVSTGSADPGAGISSSAVDGMIRRVRTEIDGVQRAIENLQTELLRLREQERLLAELGATTID